FCTVPVYTVIYTLSLHDDLPISAQLLELGLDEFCEGVEVHEFHLQALVDGVVSGQNLSYCFWDDGAVSVNWQMLLPLQYLCVMDRCSEIKVLYASNKCYYNAIKCSRNKQQCKPI